jgi:hypothetical protein
MAWVTFHNMVGNSKGALASDIKVRLKYEADTFEEDFLREMLEEYPEDIEISVGEFAKHPLASEIEWKLNAKHCTFFVGYDTGLELHFVDLTEEQKIQVGLASIKQWGDWVHEREFNDIKNNSNFSKEVINEIYVRGEFDFPHTP